MKEAHEFECVEDAVQVIEEQQHDLDMAQAVIDELTQERDELRARVAALEEQVLLLGGDAPAMVH